MVGLHCFGGIAKPHPEASGVFNSSFDPPASILESEFLRKQSQQSVRAVQLLAGKLKPPWPHELPHEREASGLQTTVNAIEQDGDGGKMVQRVLEDDGVEGGGLNVERVHVGLLKPKVCRTCRLALRFASRIGSSAKS